MIMPAVKIVSARSAIVKVHECLCLAMTCRCPFVVDSHATVVNVLDFVAHCLLRAFARFDTCHKRCRENTPQYRAFDSGRRSSSSLLCGIVRSLRTSSSRSIHSDILSTSSPPVHFVATSAVLTFPGSLHLECTFFYLLLYPHILGFQMSQTRYTFSVCETAAQPPSPLSVSTRMMTNTTPDHAMSPQAVLRLPSQHPAQSVSVHPSSVL